MIAAINVFAFRRNLMTELGKRIRLERIVNRKSGKTILVPMDHGLTIGTVAGLENIPLIINKIANGGANGVVLHSGIALAGHRGSAQLKGNELDIGLIIHLNGSTTLSPHTNRKVMVCSVEEALRLGADAVSLHINIGAEEEPEMLEQMGNVTQKCRYWGMPLIAMMYPRGPNIKNPNDPTVVNIAARAGAELGADIVKTIYTGDIDSFATIVKGCPVPIVIAGGPKMDTKRELLQMVWEAMQAGCMGVAIGRNIFQDPDPTLLLRTMAKIIHENFTVDEAIKATHLKI
jgi:fructose-bisphosphate aldolase/2-amino-3,7-dideoxy-D-threo-hept-6-ulosonate synthase